MTFAARLMSACLLALAMAGCSTLRPALTPAKPMSPTSPAYDFEALSRQENNSDETLVIVSLSGGGLKAAAFAYGVLDAMRILPVTRAAAAPTWLDEIDVVSGVSGGSFAAAYFVGRRDDFFARFRHDVLDARLGSRLNAQLDNPINWYRLSSAWFSTAHLVERTLDREVFAGRSFGDLAREGRRPLLLISATDLALGAAFEFSREQFDLICADLNAVPLARAVTASSAVPLLIAPVTLRNYAGRCPEPALDTVTALTAEEVADLDNRRSYLDAASRPYLHLVDGGLVDNLAVRTLFEAAGRSQVWAELPRYAGVRPHVVLVMVDAETAPDFAIDRSERTPRLRDIALAASRTTVSNRSAETRRYLQDTLQKIAQRWQETAGGLPSADVGLSLVHIRLQKALDQLPDVPPLPFGLDLPPQTVDLLIAAGRAEAAKQLAAVEITPESPEQAP